MDYIVWSRIIGPLAIMIFVIYVIISSNRAVKELVQKKSEANNQVNASVKNESALPPFVEDYQRFSLETGSAQETVKNGEADMPMGAKQAEPKLERKPIEPPPVPMDSRTLLPTKPLPVTSLIDPSPETFRQGIILAEILGRPKGLRRRL